MNSSEVFTNDESDIEMDESCASSVDGSLADEGDDDSTQSENDGNMAWASAMSRVLKTSSRGTSFILSKAKKDSDIKTQKKKDVEYIDSSGKVIQIPKLPEEKSITYSEKRKEMIERQRKKASWETMCLVKPDVLHKERERELVKIATRGVVHLFNTVEKHQKTVKSSKKDSKKEKKPNVMKGNFMDILKEFSKKDKAPQDDPVKKVPEAETWSILKDDFMMGAEMKDWDKESDQET